jgi:NDP-sugar pyrophosphorylase family protein
VPVARPLLYTGVCVLSPRLLPRIPPGQAALVADLWAPLLGETRDEIGWLLHGGPFEDLGRPSDFLRASLEALDRGGAFPEGEEATTPAGGSSLREPQRVSTCPAASRPGGFGAGARIADSAVWDGVESAPALRSADASRPAEESFPARATTESSSGREDGLAAEYPLS